MSMVYIWLAVIVVSLVIEAMTVQMMAVWFAPAGLVAMIMSLLNAPVWSQITAFILVAGVCVATLYRKLRKNISESCEKTNIDAIIGSIGVVEEDIPALGSGRVKIKGISWLATSEKAIALGERVKILSIDGVTVNCESIKEEVLTK